MHDALNDFYEFCLSFLSSHPTLQTPQGGSLDEIMKKHQPLSKHMRLADWLLHCFLDQVVGALRR